jgi:multiple antibiotic resistance protein
MNETGALPLSMVFTAFMVMLGPVKIVGPFAALSTGLTEADARRLAARAIVFACVGGIVAASIGQRTLGSWGIAPFMLHLAAGLILFLVALRTVLEQYETPAPPTAAAPRDPALAPLAFPTILTPHGIATFILLLALTTDMRRELTIVALFAVVMVINVIVMCFARPIVRRGGVGLSILGAVLSVLQVALAIKMVVEALRSGNLVS